MAIIVNDRADVGEAIKCSRLSLKAKGLYLYLSQLKNKSSFSVDKIIAESRDNRASVYAGLKELEDKKFLVRESVRKAGKIDLFVYFLLTENLHTENREDILVLYSTTYNDNIINSSNNKKSSHIRKNMSCAMEQEIEELLAYWSKNITNHKKDKKTYQVGRERLIRKYNHINRNRLLLKRREKKYTAGFKKIKSAMMTYKILLNNPDTVFTNEQPYKVSIKDFFGFSHYLKKKHKAEIDHIGSWFAECSKGRDYCLKKYGRLTRVEKALLRIAPTKDEQTVIKAAERFAAFHAEVKDRLKLPDKMDAASAVRFTKYLAKYAGGRRRFKLYYILNENFLSASFTEWLEEMDWL